MTKKNIDEHRKPLALLVLVCVLSILIVGVYFYHSRSTSLFTQMKSWIDKKRAYLESKSWEKAKKQKETIAVNKDINKDINKDVHAPTIQFEFYETLPTMQVTVPVPKENIIKNAELEGNNSIKKEKKIVSSKDKFFNAETLKREFARDLNLK